MNVNYKYRKIKRMQKKKIEKREINVSKKTKNV